MVERLLDTQEVRGFESRIVHMDFLTDELAKVRKRIEETDPEWLVEYDRRKADNTLTEWLEQQFCN